MESSHISPPFSKAHQLCNDFDLSESGGPGEEAKLPLATLPGHPCIMLNDSVRVKQFLDKEFCAHDLEAMAPHLWVMSTQSSANVNALHRQRVKGREIVVTEDPRLHLVWIHDRIFIKPIPRYLLSHTFWGMFLNKSSQLGGHQDTIRKAAMGYLRTFSYLIQHESDFIIAQQDHLRLIPQDLEWAKFCRFVSELACIKDGDVSGRYYSGELRLTRLNFYAPFFLRKAYFEQVHGQYSDYFARLYGPIFFIFAIMSTTLNAMQVEMAVEQVSATPWFSMWPLSRWFSIMSLVGAGFIFLCFTLLWSWMILDEWIYAIKCLRRRRREIDNQSKC